MEIPTLVRRHLYSEMGPWLLIDVLPANVRKSLQINMNVTADFLGDIINICDKYIWQVYWNSLFPKWISHYLQYVIGLVQDCRNSITNTLELL